MAKTPFDRRRLVRPGVVIALSLSWSWLLRLRMANLTQSQLFGYFSALLGFLVIVGLSAVVFISVIRYFVRAYGANKQLGPWFVVKLFFIWAAVEWLVSLLVVLIWYGQGGRLDTVLPFGSFTPLLMYTPFGYLARFLGFYGTSAAFVVLASSVAFAKLRTYAPWAYGIAAVLLLLSWAAYRKPNGAQTNVQVVSSVHGVLPPLAQNAELTLVPEYGLNDIDSTKLAAELGNQNNQHFVVGSTREDSSQGVQNVLIFASNKQGIIEKHAKARLIPAGEYLPYTIQGLVNVTRANTVREQFKIERQLVPGQNMLKPLSVRSRVQLGSGVCASIISPDDYRQLTKNGATLLTNSAELNIFDSSVFDVEHEGLARFMAVANARPFAQSAADAHSFVLDHNGRPLTKLMPIGTTTVNLTLNQRKTPYTYIGEWVVYMGTVYLLILGAKPLKKKLFS